MSSRGTVPLAKGAEEEEEEEEEEDPKPGPLDAADFLAAVAEVGFRGGRRRFRSLICAWQLATVRGRVRTGVAPCLIDTAGVKVWVRVTSSGDGEGVP